MSTWSSWLAGSELDEDSVEEKRMRVLRLHVEELNRQAAAREAELLVARKKLKSFEDQRAEAAPREKKLFAKLEQLQAELKLAKDHRGKADTRAAELATQLEQVVDAAQGETATSGQQMLLKVTTEQLEATQTALQQALRRVADAERLANDACAEAKRAREQHGQAEQREALLGRRFSTLVEKSSQASMLQLPPPSKGKDLAEQHHILQLNYRHLQSEVRQKGHRLPLIAADCRRLPPIAADRRRLPPISTC